MTAGCALAAVAIVYFARAQRPRGPAPDAVVIVIEAELAAQLPEGMCVEEVTRASGGRAVSIPRAMSIPEGAAEDADSVGDAVYSFRLARPTTVALWLRARWNDGCGNSIGVCVNSAVPQTATDGAYRTWHWVRAGQLKLGAGRHLLELQPREDGVAVDQICITSDLGYYPQGVLDSGLMPVTPAAGEQDLATVQPPPQSVKPFLAAVGGVLRGGFEGAMIRLGIPYERVSNREFTDPEFLRCYDLLCLSAPEEVSHSKLFAALEEYVRQGGVVVMEDPTPQYRILTDDPDRLGMGGRGGHHQNRYCSLQTDSSPVFEGAQNKTIRLDGNVRCATFPTSTNLPGATIVGRILSRRREVGGAIFRRPFGKGVFYFSAVPLSFHSLWRGTRMDWMLKNLIMAAAAGKCRPLYEDMPWTCEEVAGTLHFGDDFMRSKGDPGASWRIEQGEFSCTGRPPYVSHRRYGRVPVLPAERAKAFSLRAGGPGVIAAVGNPQWRDLRMSASVLAGASCAGIWLGATGGRICLTLDAKNSRLFLVRKEEDGPTILADCQAPSQGQWRRLSLWWADGAWHGYLDGLERIRHPEQHAPGPGSGFGLLVEDGSVLFDDVAVRPVADLMSGSDRAPGEEGSCQALAAMKPQSIEARNIYTRQWYLRPSPAGDGAVRVALPNYVPGSLIVDGKSAPVPASPESARVPLPTGSPVRSGIYFRCDGWRDYVFGDRLTDWYSLEGDWQPHPRWSCDISYQWLGIKTRKRTVLWHRAALSAPYCLSALMGVGDLRWLGRETRTHGRDLNLVVAGDGQELESGFRFRLRAAGRGGCELWHRQELLASAPEEGLPQGNYLYHIWFDIRVIAEPRRLRLFLEGRPVLDYALAEPLPVGQVGLWTQDNYVNVARATLSVSQQPQPSARPSQSVP